MDKRIPPVQTHIRCPCAAVQSSELKEEHAAHTLQLLIVALNPHRPIVTGGPDWSRLGEHFFLISGPERFSYPLYGKKRWCVVSVNHTYDSHDH